MHRIFPLFLSAGLGLGSPTLGAQELPTALTAKFVKIVVSASGNAIACEDTSLRAALEAEAVKVDANAKAIWVTSPAKAKMAKTMGRLVIGFSANLIAQGAGVVITEQGGKPRILINAANIKSSGITLPDAIYKAGEAM